MEAAKWQSKYSGSVQNLTLMQKDRTLGEWMPHESVCLTVDEARIARDVNLHRKAAGNKPL
jgi:riboflavin synthase alpha subunit